VAKKLTGLGVPAGGEDVVTSAQAAARLIRDEFGTGVAVAYLGAIGLRTALEEEGLVPVGADDPAAVALSTGYGPDVVWREIMRAAVRVEAGLPWIASNTDLSIPTDFGVAPGHGVFVRMVSEFTGVTPTVAGKPERPLLDETMRRMGGDRPLMIGDRLDTDIEGAHNAGIDSLLVLTGVSGLSDLVGAPAALRPSYISPGLAGLSETHAAPMIDQRSGSCELGGWRASIESEELSVAGTGAPEDWWRVAVTAAWIHLDKTGTPASIRHTTSPVPRAPGPAL